MTQGTCGHPPCNCPLGADECDGSYGIFLPGTANGDCVVQPCQKAQPRLRGDSNYTMGNWFRDLENPHGNR